MDIASLAFRTDLAMLEHSGSSVEDRGTHLVVRTPDNPTYWWGNFLLLHQPPADADAAREWLATFESEFTTARHRTFGVDGQDGSRDDLAPFAELGLTLDVSTVMTATSVHEPPRPNTIATYRRLETDADWQQQIEMTMAGEDEGYEDERLLASMGLFTASPGLARFQSVKTHPDARGRGLAGTLVHRVSRYGFDELGAQTLVMVADPDYLAIRIYRSVGFADTERQLQAERKPTSA
jgi:ribosomal protein S18 acetylase RimI-like enzyme